MNRRKFITTSAIGAGALTMLPTSIIASNNVKSLSSLNKITNISLSSLPFNFKKAHESLMLELNELGYVYDSNKLIKLSSNCYAISVQKKSLLGFTSEELALLVEESGSSKYYILEEKLAIELNSLVENYRYNMDANNFSYDLAEFAFPVKIQEVKKGKESVFSYKNKMNNTITLQSNRKRSRAIIC